MKNKSINLYERLLELEDFRRWQWLRHSLSLILIIVIMAVMSGYNWIRATWDFAKKHRKELIKIFKIKKKNVPSFQTISRVLLNIDFNKFADIFKKWASDYVKINKKEWLSLDWKAIRWTVANPNNKFQKYTNLVSVFSNKKLQVLSAKKISSNKSSEIPIVRELIKELDLEDVTFTIDALHCQKETTKTIVKSKNNYVIGTKGNQKKLHDQLKKTQKIVNL